MLLEFKWIIWCVLKEIMGKNHRIRNKNERIERFRKIKDRFVINMLYIMNII